MTPRVVTHPAELAGAGHVVVAMGTFDGMHLGHQAVLAQCVNAAKACGGVAAALFFEPSPREVLDPAHAPQLLTTPARRLELMRAGGIEAAIQYPFTQETARTEAAEFLRREFFSVPGLRLRAFCIGEEWRFGRGNAGDVPLLRQIAARHGVAVHAVPPMRDGGGVISSTRIRAHVAAGEFAAAAAMLGRPYSIDGTVVAGAGVAHERLSCPTANLDEPRLQLPPYGVYAARTTFAGEDAAHLGIAYIGDAPTLRSDGKPILELHLFDFDGNLYGRRISVEPVRFLRPSRRFADAAALSAQIQRDLAAARAALKDR